MQTTLFDFKKTFPIKKGKVKSENYEEFVAKFNKETPFEIKKSDCTPTFGKERALNFGGSFSVGDEVLQKLKELEKND